jgi:hypothetical protein
LKKIQKEKKKQEAPPSAGPAITTSGPFPILSRPDPARADDAIGASPITDGPLFFFFFIPCLRMAKKEKNGQELASVNTRLDLYAWKVL